MDTVAQKPTHIGLGARFLPDVPDAHHDGHHPTDGAQPPWEEPPARLGEAEHVAAGLKAIASSASFTLKQVGPVRGVQTWLKINKKDGFDCQSCAWPSPDNDRHVFEFCENGVKGALQRGDQKTHHRRVFPRAFHRRSAAAERLLVRAAGTPRRTGHQTRRCHSL